MNSKVTFLLSILVIVVSCTSGFGFSVSPAKSLIDPHTGTDKILISIQENSGNPEWQGIITAEDLWDIYPEKINRIFSALNLQFSGLEPVREALNAADTIAAAKALLDYYQISHSHEWLRSESDRYNDPGHLQLSKQVLEAKVDWRGVAVEIPKTVNGGWDWNYTGTEHDAEFGYTLNRHGYFLHLLRGWQETGNAVYAEKFDRIIRDWIINNPLPEKDDPFWEVHRTSTMELDWRDIGEVIWRDLDAGIRLGESWPQAFFGFQQAEAFTPAGRLLMLYSMLVHTQYLQDYHKTNHNWATMEMNGLGYAGLIFPEFEQSDKWIQYALEVMQSEINGGQVYPDGVQQELATHTHWVALSRFETMVENFRNAGRTVPSEYLQRIEAMYDYLAYSMRPDGHQPLNNDSDREDVRPRVLKAAELYNRPDWIYIATNGERGEKPEGLASKVFPWSGLHVMRNGWDKMSHWAFYKTGPYGIGHQHRDKLHLSIHAFGRDLLVDSGRYTHEDYFSFNPTIWRGYFRSSFSQNVILVDEAGQGAWSLIADEPHREGRDFINTADFDYARGTFTGEYEQIGGQMIEGSAEHTRALLYVKDKYWIVVDRIATDRPRKLQALWRYGPKLTTVIEGDQVVSIDEGMGNLRIVPASDISWDLELIEGQTEPFIQGWYSETYGKKEPNPTAVYSTHVENDTIFAWVLVPADGNVPPVKASLTDKQAVTITIEIEGEDPLIVTLPLDEGSPIID